LWGQVTGEIGSDSNRFLQFLENIFGGIAQRVDFIPGGIEPYEKIFAEEIDQ
jgi:hypothetical protein